MLQKLSGCYLNGGKLNVNRVKKLMSGKAVFTVQCPCSIGRQYLYLFLLKRIMQVKQALN